jgi:hypothetical protein
MKTFVIEDTLYDYTSGLIVVKAKNLKEAIELINKDNRLSYTSDYLNIGNIRELKDNEIVYVIGGG